MAVDVVRAATHLSNKECWRITRTTLFVDPRCRQKVLLQRYADDLYNQLQEMRDHFSDSPEQFYVDRPRYTAFLFGVMSPMLAVAYLNGHRDMTAALGTKQPLSDGLRNEAVARAHFSADTMWQTTAEHLQGVTPDDLAGEQPWGFSKARAATAVDYESTLGYRTSAHRAIVTSGQDWGKAWAIDPASHDKEDICDDNEAVGIIPLNEPFPSGDQFDPAHLYCACSVYYARL